METFADKFKELRKKSMLTQQALADLTLIPRRTIQDWEKGKMEPPEWCQRLVLAELERLAQNNE